MSKVVITLSDTEDGQVEYKVDIDKELIENKDKGETTVALRYAAILDAVLKGELNVVAKEEEENESNETETGV